MTNPKDLPPDLMDLRRRAEAQLVDEVIPPEKLSPDQAVRLIHELRVHQIELEMQNDELRRSQALLEESRTKYADLYDFAPVGYLTLDTRGKIVEANLSAATLLGVERSKLLNRFFSHFLVEADRLVFRQLMNNDLNQTARRGEVHLQDAGGNVRVILLDILLVTDAEGKERRRISLTDITERKHTQEELVAHRTSQLIKVNEELRQANEQLEALFAAAPIAIGMFDTEGKIVNVNLAAEHIFGWSKEDLEGRLPRSIPPNNPEETMVLIQRALRGESFTGVEVRQQQKNGSQIDVSLSAAPLFDAQGKQRGFVGLAEDITERKKLAEDVRAQALVLENMAEGVTVIDQRGQIVYTNPAFDAMFGYGPGELVGQHSNVLNFYPPEENLGMVKEILDRLKTTGLWTGKFRNCKKGGEPFFTSARISTLTVGGKKLYISVQEDVTQRKRAQEMVKRQAELLDLAHDAIFVTDLVGRITYWNHGAEELYGWTKAEAMGEVPHRLLATVFPQPLEDIETQVLEQGFWEGGLTHTSRDGRVLVVDSRWTLKRDGAGQPLAILEINRDLTARRQAEEALRKSEARFRRLVEANVVGLAVFNEDKIVEANDEFLRLVGHTQEEMLAGEVKWMEMTPREYIPQDARALYEMRMTGAHTPYEKTLVRRDGSQAPVVVGGAILEEEPMSWVSFVLDISDRKRLEDSLRLSEARFRAIFANASIGIATTDLEGLLQEFNAPVLQSLGYTPTELKGTDFRDFTYPDDLAVDQGLFTSLVKGEQDQYQVEKRFVSKDGRVLWGRVYVSLVRGPRGEPDFTVSLVEDITAQKESQAALAESEARYRSLVDLSPDAIVVHARGHYVFANPAGLRLFGAASPEDLLGRRVLDLVHPDSQELVKRRVDAGERLDIREVKILRLNGEVVEVEVAATPILYGGQPAVQVVIRDITERKVAEAALRVSENRFRAFMDNSPTIAWAKDEDGRHIYLSKTYENRFDVRLENWRGKTDFDLWPTRIAEEFRRNDLAVLASGQPIEVIEETINPDGGSCYWLNSKFIFEDVGGKRYVGGIGVDITERKRAEEVLRQSEARERVRAGELQVILDTSPGFIFLAHDHEGRVITGNRAAYELLRRTPGTNLSKSAREDERPDNFRIMKDGRVVPGEELPVQRAAAHGETVSDYEIDLVFDDGTVRHLLGDAVPLLDEAGQPRGAIAAFLDITARKESEESLARKQAEFEAIFSSITDGVVFTDPERRIVLANPAAEALFGYSQEEMQGRTTEFTYASREDYEEQGRLRYHTRPDQSQPIYEITYRRQDGTVFPAEVRGAQVKDTQGRVIGFVSIHRDITERKAAEEALREREAKLSSILTTTPVGIGLIFDRVIEEVNQQLCQMTGYAPEELLGKSSRLLYPTQEEFDQVGLEKYRQIRAYGIGSVETRWQRRDGSIIDILLSSAPLIPGDISAGVTFTVLDITDRKRAEEALRRAHDELEERVEERTAALSRANEQLLLEFQERLHAEKALKESELKLRYLAEQLLTAQENERRRLAAELHDELGHMLLTLKLALSSISEELLPDQVNLKEEIQDQLKHIKDVIGEVRRLYHDLSPGDLEDLGLTPALETLVENFASLQGQIIFKMDLPDLTGLFSLPVQTIVYRMVQEALTNIGKHAHPEHVTIKAVKEGERVRFTIEDDGQGFDVAQVLGATGHGIGLVAMEERLRMVGGTLNIHSRKQEGTKLSFTIPVLLGGDQP
jgi:PAS domain S-box-containing protein